MPPKWTVASGILTACSVAASTVAASRWFSYRLVGGANSRFSSPFHSNALKNIEIRTYAVSIVSSLRKQKKEEEILNRDRVRKTERVRAK